jgi:hypothetical protein
MSTRIEITDLMAKGIHITDPIKNQDFAEMDELLRVTGWYMVLNEENHIAYAYPGFDLEYYDIEIYSDKVYVSFPLKNRPYQYHMWFSSVEETLMYMERHYDNFMPSKLQQPQQHS